jgi:hypothetical protein
MGVGSRSGGEVDVTGAFVADSVTGTRGSSCRAAISIGTRAVRRRIWIQGAPGVARVDLAWFVSMTNHHGGPWNAGNPLSFRARWGTLPFRCSLIPRDGSGITRGHVLRFPCSQRRPAGNSRENVVGRTTPNGLKET